MKKKRSLLKTIIIGILAGLSLVAISLYFEPVKLCDANHGWSNAGSAAGGAMVGSVVGACIADQMAQNRAMAQPQTTVIVTGHQHGPGCGHTYFNEVWYPNSHCSYDADGVFLGCQ